MPSFSSNIFYPSWLIPFTPRLFRSPVCSIFCLLFPLCPIGFIPIGFTAGPIAGGGQRPEQSLDTSIDRESFSLHHALFHPNPMASMFLQMTL
ncbi:hypothetical protein M752DRAFT_67268 [Aspergillus phoenicis ATCC 13157]|uniref:Uncharacterized protein n=1 Tax=Aspergillus phoenicis ATCC 13157 TaxID=1353007 RepID=A0A370PXN4_ASPPH|nr:hypothetical protein M752DRAFT_67268 [Aspergillus phoenicis ATCC 13157]